MSDLNTLDVEFEYVTTAAMAEQFAPVVREAKRLYLDTETAPKPQYRHNKRAGLVPAMSNVRLLQLYVHKHPVWIIDLFRLKPDDFPELAEALTAKNGPVTVAHNAVFDCGQLIGAGLAIPQRRWRCTAMQERHLTCGQMIQGIKKKKRDRHGFDTDSEAFDWETADIEDQERQLSRDLNDNEITYRPVPCDLASTAARRCNIHLPKEAQRSDWSQPELDVEFQLKYCARDAEILRPIDNQQVHEIERDGMEKAVALDNLCIEPVARAQMRGIRLSPEGWPALIHQLKLDRVETEQALLQTVSDSLVEIGELKLNTDMLGRIRSDKTNGWKPGSRDQVLATFRKLGIEIDDLSKTARGLCTSTHPALAAFNSWKASQSMVQAAESYLKHICPADGLIHGDFSIFRADTGRMSISRPSLQNLPRGSNFRSNIVALGPGRLLVGADLPNIEVRIAALISGDQVLRQIFIDGKDPYKEVAAVIERCSYADVTPLQRKLAKPCTLGLIFSMGAKGLAQYSTLSFGQPMTEETAKRYRREFFQRFWRLAQWHSEMDDMIGQPAYIPVECRSVLGRRRKLEGWHRKLTTATNTPIQSSAGELAKAIVASLPAALEKAGCRDTGLILAVHDEFVLDAPAQGGEAEAAARVLAHVMQTTGERLMRGIPCPVKAVVGSNWAEAKE